MSHRFETTDATMRYDRRIDCFVVENACLNCGRKVALQYLEISEMIEFQTDTYLGACRARKEED